MTDALVCRELVKRCNFDHGLIGQRKDNWKMLLDLYRKTRFLTVDLVYALPTKEVKNLDMMERLDYEMLIHNMPMWKFHMIPVHDSFAVLAKNCDELCKQYRYAMQQLWDSTVLEHIAECITGKREESRKYEALINGVHAIS